uniref:Uncharacterized protein n=1 Tax=Romanomermis culicivorax TaxID=13658 RepID=A0A915IZI0_ROMCU
MKQLRTLKKSSNLTANFCKTLYFNAPADCWPSKMPSNSVLCLNSSLNYFAQNLCDVPHRTTQELPIIRGSNLSQCDSDQFKGNCSTISNKPSQKSRRSVAAGTYENKRTIVDTLDDYERIYVYIVAKTTMFHLLGSSLNFRETSEFAFSPVGARIIRGKLCALKYIFWTEILAEEFITAGDYWSRSKVYCWSRASIVDLSKGIALPIFQKVTMLTSLPRFAQGFVVITFARKKRNRYRSTTNTFYFFFILSDQMELVLRYGNHCGQAQSIVCEKIGDYDDQLMKIGKIVLLKDNATLNSSVDSASSEFEINQAGEYTCTVQVQFYLGYPPTLEARNYSKSIIVEQRCLLQGIIETGTFSYHILIGVGIVAIAVLLILAIAICYERHLRVTYSRSACKDATCIQHHIYIELCISVVHGKFARTQFNNGKRKIQSEYFFSLAKIFLDIFRTGVKLFLNELSSLVKRLVTVYRCQLTDS